MSGAPTEVALKQLTHVHTGRNAQWVENYVDRRTVCHIRHVLNRQNLTDNALVTVTTRDLIALLNLSALRNVDANQRIDSWRKLIALLVRAFVFAVKAYNVNDAAI